MESTLQNFSTSLAVPLPVLLLGGGVLLWTAYGILYRLFLSPVAGIPGPKLAAMTFWYEFYYDVIKHGKYTWKIQQLHKKYGPIIRINPYEVHIDDPDYYDTLYVGAAQRKTDKWWWTADMFSIPGSTISTEAHDLHRKRRAMFSSHFSTASVHRLEPVLRAKVDKLVQRLDLAARKQEVVSLTHAFAALTVDVITGYTFAESYNYLDAPDFDPRLFKFIHDTGIISHVSKQMPWIMPTVMRLPKWLSLRIFPEQTMLVGQLQGYARQVEHAREKKRLLAESSSPEKTDDNKQDSITFDHSIFNTMLSANVPASELSTDRLSKDAQTLVIAGTVTTAHALETVAYHLIANPALTAPLAAELSAAQRAGNYASTSAIPLSKLESLPYLTAVIREGLRLSYGVPHRLQRVSPSEPLRYGAFVIPPGTPVSMSALLVHENEDLFPEAKTFRPERWLPLDGAASNKLAGYLVPFSKGSRQCVGMNLAWAELYLGLAAVFDGGRKFEFFEFNYERDVKTVIDGFNPMPSRQSRGLRVKVEGSGKGEKEVL